IKIIKKISQSYEAIKTDRKGGFWGFIPGKGAFYFGRRCIDLENPSVFLSGLKVSNLFEDKQGNLWFITNQEGVYCLPRLNAKQWSLEDGLRSLQLSSITNGTRIISGLVMIKVLSTSTLIKG
ncbi:MAG: two-component regulator propeller domain-containing protein, partial [Bacteroidota bacterium]